MDEGPRSILESLNHVFAIFYSSLADPGDATQPNGWANEIHPWYPGFTALANSFLVGLQAMPAFKNRI